MGYAATNTIIYGVKLTTERVQKIFEKEIKEAEEKDECIGDHFYKIIPNSDLICEPNSYRPEDRRYDRKRFYVKMLTPDADSRINNLAFDPEVSDIHYFGIYCATNGYAYSDNIKEYLINTPDKAKENFDKYVLPILAKHGIETSPETHIVLQVH